MAEGLEQRQLLAGDVFVNDNWNLVSDVDTSGTVTAGDIVNDANDAGGPTATYTLDDGSGTTSLQPGTDGLAFGEVTTDSGSGAAPGAVVAANTVQEAIDAVDVGGNVHVLAGTYAENLVISDSVEIHGAGASNTTLQPAGNISRLIQITGSGYGGVQSVRISGVALDGLSGTADYGIRVESTADFATLSVADSTFTGFDNIGLAVFGDSSTGLSAQNVALDELMFTDNGISGGGGAGDIQLFEYNGDAALSDLTLTGNRDENAGTGARSGLQLRGVGAGDGTGVLASGTVSLSNVDVSGDYRTQMIGLQRYSDVSAITFGDVALGGAASQITGTFGASLRIDAVGSGSVAVPASMDLADTHFRGLDAGSAQRHELEFAPDNGFAFLKADATDTSWTIGGSPVAAGGLTTEQDLGVEDRILHYPDKLNPVHGSYNGFAEVVANTAFVTDAADAGVVGEGSIERAVEMVPAGGDVRMGAGTYGGEVTINKRVTLTGAGDGNDPNVDTIIDASGQQTAVELTSGGDAANDRLRVQDLRVTGGSQQGLLLNSSVSHITLENVTADDTNRGIHVRNAGNVSDFVLNNVTLSNNDTGFRLSTGGAIDGLAVSGSSFVSNRIGMSVFANGSASDNETRFTDVSFADTALTANLEKGLYFEALDNAMLDGLTVQNSGTSSSYAFNNGIDINLKYGDYSDITVRNSVFDGSGVHTVDHNSMDFAATLAIKARDDGATYGANPATLAGVSVENNTFANTTTAIRVGEPGANNAGPSDVQIVSNALSDGTFTGVDNVSLATVDASGNWWGTSDETTVASLVSSPAKTDFSPYLDSGTDTSATAGFQGDFATLHVTALGAQAGSVGRIEEAVDLVDVGGTVLINSGTYDEGPQVVIDKDVTIIGEDRATTTVTPVGNTGSSGDSRGWFLVEPGFDVHVSELTFDGSGYDVYQAFRHKGTGSFDTVAFENIRFSKYVGFGIAAFGGAGPVDVLNSTFEHIERVGVLYFGAGTTGTFSGNTYVGKGAGDYLDYAMDIGAGATVEAFGNAISNNRGVAASDGSTSAGILVTTFFGGGTSLNSHDNIISDNSTGIVVGFNASDTSDAVIRDNEIVDNDRGVAVVGATALLEGNDLRDNSNVGLLVRGGATVDAGQDGSFGDFTGLGISSGGNNFSSYNNTGRIAYTDPGAAIRNLNDDTGTPVGFDVAPPDVTAQNNLFFSTTESDIETVVDHEVDDDTKGFVDFSDPAPILVQDGKLFISGGSDKDKIEIKGDQPNSDDLEVKLHNKDVKIHQTVSGITEICIFGNGGDDDIKIKDGVHVACLQISGGDGKDDVKIEQVMTDQIVVDAGDGDDRVKIKKDVVVTNDIGIVVHGGDGDDDLKLDKKVMARAFLFGELGNDKLHGGGGQNVLVGGDGDDDLKGGDTFDVVIGGDGKDKVDGKKGDDYLIGGFTDIDSNLAALDALLTDWTDDSDIDSPPTISDDGDKDDLKGGNGDDVIEAGAGDKVKS